MKKNTVRSILSLILSVILVYSMTMTIFAETTIINNSDGTVTERNTDENLDGTGADYSVTVTITEKTTGPRNDGTDFESKVETTEKTNYEDYRKDSMDWTEDGYSKTTQTESPDGLTVEVPLEEGQSDSKSTQVPDPNPAIDGDVKTGDDDTDYDYTVTTVTPGKVTVTTEDITVNETASDKTNMDYTHTETGVTDDNDLFTSALYKGNPTCVDPTNVPEDMLPEAVEGYGYNLVSTGNSSQFYAGFLYKTPGYEGEQPAYIAQDGTPYYAHRTDLGNYHKLEGAYLDGKMDAETDTVYKAIWANVAQYVLVDAETGELITTYCADVTTQTQDGFGYNMQNIEDASYYTEEQAEMIRTIAKNGYWGVLDDESTPDAETGSLSAMQQMMTNALDADGNRVFTDDEVAALTDGIAMSATQYAIWNFSNHMDDIQILNSQYIAKGEDNTAAGWSYTHLKNIPADEMDSVALIFKLYNHLINMEPTKTTNTSKDTIYTKDNFVDDIKLTVMDKVAAEDHENNRDTNKDNDAYYTTLSFALVVAPAERGEDEPQDDLVVTLYDSKGNVMAKGRIAGELGEGEIRLLPDENNNYAFTNIVMTEGSQKFSLNLTGIQYLDEGIYLYSSEIIPETEGADTDNDKLKGSDDLDGVSSQTMVGMAGGAHGLNVSMEITFNVNVDDEIIVTEHFWHDEGTLNYDYPTYDDPTPEIPNDPTGDEYAPMPMSFDEEIEDEEVPLNEEPEEEEDYEEPAADEIEILDEEVPLAEVPETGDASDVMMMIVIFAAIGLIAVNLPAKKRYNA